MDKQTDTGANSQEDHPGSQTSAPIVLSELALHPPSWPADGFADDDPAALNMVDILHSFDLRSVRPSAAEDFIIYPPTNHIRPFYQLSRRQTADGSNYNFLFSNPDEPGQMVGKVDFSKTGLTIILQAIRLTVRNNGGPMPFSPLSQHVDRLNAATGAMEYVRPKYSETEHCYCASVNPFTPEGVRTAAAVLQAAARDSSCDYALFNVFSVLDVILNTRGKLEACIAVFPMIGWQNQDM